MRISAGMLLVPAALADLDAVLLVHDCDNQQRSHHKLVLGAGSLRVQDRKLGQHAWTDTAHQALRARHVPTRMPTILSCGKPRQGVSQTTIYNYCCYYRRVLVGIRS